MRKDAIQIICTKKSYTYYLYCIIIIKVCYNYLFEKTGGCSLCSHGGEIQYKIDCNI